MSLKKFYHTNLSFPLGIFFLFTIVSCNQSLESKKLSGADTMELQNKQNLAFWKEHTTVCNYIKESGNLGFWGFDSAQLPVFQYTGLLPAKSYNAKGKDVGYSEDPMFIMGNNLLTLFTHASGEYELLTLERSVARLNRGEKPNSGENFANVKINNKSYDLVGEQSLLAMSPETEKSFGCGFAAYKYNVENNISVERLLTTVPSMKITDGCPAFRIQVKIKNNSDKKIEFEYSEGLTARYDFLFEHNYKGLNIRTKYPVSTFINKKINLVKARFIPQANTTLVLNTNKLEHSISESFPPQVCLQMNSSPNLISEVNFNTSDSLSSKIYGTKSGSIDANSTVTLDYYVGYNLYENEDKWDNYVAQLNEEKTENIAFRSLWKKRLPEFTQEKDTLLRAEMIWNAYVLYSMTTWSELYKELYVPQGNLYEYALGVGGTTSDNMMMILPFNYLDTAFAKSMIKYGLKQTNFRGFTNPTNEGGCRIPQAPWIKSHTPLYYLMVIAEYLHTTKDTSILSQNIPFWGMDYSQNGTVLDRMKRIFLYLRDEVYVGDHGLVRLLLSDWNDAFYFIFKDENFFKTFSKGESFSNTAMALQYFELLANTLEEINTTKNQDIAEFVKALRDYRSELKTAFIKEWNSNSFVPRAYVGSGKKIGIDNLFLEPNAFVLGIQDISKEKRLTVWNEIKKRNWNKELLGARQAEKAIGYGLEGVGSGENAAFWYSLNGPMINGLIKLDKKEAVKALNRVRFSNHAKHFPNTWVGMWSGADTFDSSLSENEGYVRDWGKIFPVFCGHSHSWALWNYYVMTEN